MRNPRLWFGLLLVFATLILVIVGIAYYVSQSPHTGATESPVATTTPTPREAVPTPPERTVPESVISFFHWVPLWSSEASTTGFFEQNGRIYWVNTEVPGNPNTFLISVPYNGYAKDDRCIFYLYRSLCSGIDLATFTPLGPFQAKDKNHVYDTGGTDIQIVTDADPATFEVVGGVSLGPNGALTGNYTKDKDSVWYLQAYKISGADPATFVALGEDGSIESFDFAKDKNHVYCGSGILGGADVNTFDPKTANPDTLDFSQCVHGPF